MGADDQGPRPTGINQDPQPLLRENHATDADMPTGLHFWNFRYKELGNITGSFQNKIAEGGFGPVYAGILDNGTPVAVKMRSQDSSQGDKEFWAEVKHLAMLCHENLVPLLGYCKDGEHLGLVYEYMAGGNVEQRLRGTTGQEAPLTWSQRLKIALDSARGLHYLHSALRTPLIHRDVKAGNILLTEKLEAKISDLGLARAISSEGKTHTITGTLSGTPGYVDPEYLKAGELRGKTDVYSFGIVLLVLITARPTSVVVGNKHVNIADWVREVLSQDRSGRHHGDISSVIDHSIRGHCDLDSARKLVELALRCAQREDVHARPTMAEVVVELEALQQPDDGASAAGTSGCSAMAEEEDDEAAAAAGVHEVVQLAEAQ
ncbi:receptor-like protein kinase At3g21340 [Miscanthus floridulus]|uniref:receptor-like protein kinase At3g21340 n=1 Tax=Miscanthus floridulus TaxID=154761 RepID=UPI003458B2AE